MMDIIPVERAVGEILYHDITRIVPGEFKGRAFKKGHRITPDDVPKLKQLGKDRVYILKLREDCVHEDDAAERIVRAISGPNVSWDEPNQGKIEIKSTVNGLLKVDVALLQQLNGLPDITIATMHTDQVVTPGGLVAGTRIVPLFTQQENLQRLEEACASAPPVVSVRPFQPLKVGLITTGNEIYHKRIDDRFGPIVNSKFEALGSQVCRQIVVPDNVEKTVQAIHELRDEGAQMIVLTGGMSVDPDDLTPAGIRASGAKVIGYGAPTYPGAMFMLADLEGIPVLGLPGCAMYHKATVFELVVPRLLAGETVTKSDIIALGHGGLCAGCPICHYPNCGFGKG
jgi:molybdenum cofactor synthesis domain-containing protein